MKVIDECCCECITQNLNRTKESCPVCNNEGVTVSRITDEHLVTDDYRNAVDGDQFWFKKDADPKYACYCSKVTEDQVIEAVVKHGAKIVKEANAITGAMKNSLCKENNPLGVCCHKIIQEAIDKGLTMKWFELICSHEQTKPLISSHKREPMLDMFPTTSVDMFPLTIGVERSNTDRKK